MVLRRRSVRVLLIVLLLIAAAVVAVWWVRRGRAPESVRLLPDGDGVVYFDVANLRRLGAFSDAGITREPEYEEFVRATGFQFERDLDEAAFAIHAGAAPERVTMDALPPDTRFSEIFIGHFDAAKLRAYLGKLAKTTERYRELEVHVIPHEGREVRVAILGVDHVAVSNATTAKPMQQMIERYQSGALSPAGPPLVAEFRERLPFGSLVWGIVRVAEGPGSAGVPPPPLLALLKGTTVVASVRPALGAQLRIEAVAENETHAQRIAEAGNAFLAIFGSLEAEGAGGADADVKEFFSSLKIQQDKQSAVLTASIPAGFLRKLVSEPPPVTAPEPAPSPTPSPKKQRQKK